MIAKVNKTITDARNNLSIIRRCINSLTSDLNTDIDVANRFNALSAEIEEIRNYYIRSISGGVRSTEEVSLLFGLSVDEINAIIDKG